MKPVAGTLVVLAAALSGCATPGSDSRYYGSPSYAYRGERDVRPVPASYAGNYAGGDPRSPNRQPRVAQPQQGRRGPAPSDRAIPPALLTRVPVPMTPSAPPVPTNVGHLSEPTTPTMLPAAPAVMPAVMPAGTALPLVPVGTPAPTPPVMPAAMPTTAPLPLAPAAMPPGAALPVTPSTTSAITNTIETVHHDPALVPTNLTETASPPGPPVRVVNSKRINLNYEVKEVGPSGVSVVELWYTLDGRKWNRADAPPPPQPPYVLDVKEEGLYGFTLVARNGIGVGKRPPIVGDQPQVWVAVDMTKPTVKLGDLQLGLNNQSQQLTINWTTSDRNLGARPVTLSYCERTDGAGHGRLEAPWTQIAANLENTGCYVWQMAPDTPRRFLVRVEVADLAGNVGSAQSTEPVIIDMSQPTVCILAVEPGAK